MTTYAFSPRSNLEDIVSAHEKRGFDVLVVAVWWQAAKALAQSLGRSTLRDQTMVVSSLARRVYECDKRGAPLFDRPTIVLLGENEQLDQAATAWKNIMTAAQASTSEVVFAYVDAPEPVLSVSAKGCAPKR